MNVRGKGWVEEGENGLEEWTRIRCWGSPGAMLTFLPFILMVLEVATGGL